MTQSEEFRALARDMAARAEASGTPALQASYHRVAEAYDRVAEAYVMRAPGRPAAVSDSIRMTRTFAPPAETRRRSGELRAASHDSCARLLGLMRASAQLQRHSRTLEFETELTLLSLPRS